MALNADESKRGVNLIFVHISKFMVFRCAFEIDLFHLSNNMHQLKVGILPYFLLECVHSAMLACNSNFQIVTETVFMQ